MLVGHKGIVASLELHSDLPMNPHLSNCMSPVMIRHSLHLLVLIMQHLLSYTKYLLRISMLSLHTLVMKMDHIWKSIRHRVAILILLIAKFVWLLFCHECIPKVLLECSLCCLALLALPWVIGYDLAVAAWALFSMIMRIQELQWALMSKLKCGKKP